MISPSHGSLSVAKKKKELIKGCVEKSRADEGRE
jgi:hypothetical protein